MKKYPALFLIGGSVYASLELLTRQRTHPSMFLAGGICLCLIDKICLGSMRHQPVAIKCAAGGGDHHRRGAGGVGLWSTAA